MTVPLYEARQQVYVPAFELVVGTDPLPRDASGKRLPRDVIRDIEAVSFVDSLNDADQRKPAYDGFTLTVNNWDADLRRPKYFGYPSRPSEADPRRYSEVFEAKHEFSLRLGYGNDLKLMTIGVVKQIEAVYPLGGAMTLKVHCVELMKRFDGPKFSKTWRNKKDSEVAEALKAAVKPGPGIGYPIKISDEAKAREPTVETIRMRNQSVLTFLRARARVRGYVVQLQFDDDEKGYLYFGPAKATAPAYKLEWGKSLLEFNPRFDAHRLKKVTVRGWNPRTGRAVEASARLRDAQCEPDYLVDQIERSGREETIVDQPIRSKAEAEKLAKDMIAAHGCGAITATGSTIGLPELRAGQRIEIGGTDFRFDGEYLLTKTTHTVDASGYRTSFEGKRKAAAVGMR